MALEAVTALAAAALRSAFGEPFDLDVPDGVGDPLRGVRFARAKKDLRRRLREHRLGVVAVAGFELTASLEAEHDRDCSISGSR